jgi:hypothetical protein
MRNTTRFIGKTILAAVMLLMTMPVLAEEYGGYAGAYLQLSVHPRATGLGSAYTAVADDAGGMFFNPAAIAQSQRFSFGGAYRVLSLDRSLQQLSVIFPVRGEAAIAFSAELASMGDIQGRTSLGTPTGELDNLDGVFSITFTRQFSHYVSLGGSARYFYKKLATESAYSIGFDVGALVHLKKGRVFPEESLIDLVRIGVAVRSISAKYPWNTGGYWGERGQLGADVTDEIPLTIVGGVSALGVNESVLLALDVEKTEFNTLKLYTGIEVKPLEYAAFRTGLSQGRPAFGIGLFAPFSGIDMQIDLAFEQSQNVGGWETIVGSIWRF